MTGGKLKPNVPILYLIFVLIINMNCIESASENPNAVPYARLKIPHLSAKKIKLKIIQRLAVIRLNPGRKKFLYALRTAPRKSDSPRVKSIVKRTRPIKTVTSKVASWKEWGKKRMMSGIFQIQIVEIIAVAKNAVLKIVENKTDRSLYRFFAIISEKIEDDIPFKMVIPNTYIIV